jgi:hypothetical protein
MTQHNEPPKYAIEAALEMASDSPRCRKSHRGCAVFRRPRPSAPAGSRPLTIGLVLSRGRNAPPGRFVCDGSAACRSACAEICVHAEAAALLDLKGVVLDPAIQLEIVHVKAVNGELQVSGPPSCHRCSALILAVPSIALVWLYHAEGWRSYAAAEFHRLSLQHNNLPQRQAVSG